MALMNMVFSQKNCLNGSGKSIKLGNDGIGAQAEGVSYTFTIPAGQNTFNLTYYYAMVLHEGNHQPFEQARMIIKVENLTDSTPLPCPLDDFIVGGSLPGFLLSSTPPPGGAAAGPIWYKDWAAASIKLNGLAGKTIRVFFKTADCTQTGHFGYAYIDIAGQCSSAFTGATYCPDDTSINVTAPFGYQIYEWWNGDYTQSLGVGQILTLNPPPLSGDSVKVIMTPYAGYGCLDTLTAYLFDTLTVISNAGPDRLSCQNAPVQLGIAPNPAWVYSWSPVTDLSDPNISNPIATPSVTTTYVLSVRNNGGGCLTLDSVEVKAAVLDNSIVRTGITVYCLGDPQGAVLTVQPADSIQWYQNGVAIPGANGTQYMVVQTGSYHATVFSFQGCNLTTADEDITVYAQPATGFTANAIEQCFNGHQFVFTNTSIIAAGTITYNWDLGDGTTSTATNVTHSYAVPGTYFVKLIVTSDNGCTDSLSFNVTVKDSPLAGFTIDNAEECFTGNQFTFSNTSNIAKGSLLYRWDMGDGNFVSSQDVIYSYAQPGTYTVKLIALGDNDCVDSIYFDVTVNPEPTAGFAVNNVQQCLDNNQFVFTNTSSIAWGNLNYVWYFGDGTTATTTDVTHTYAAPGSYTVKLVVTSDKGCMDSIFFAVKIYAIPFASFLLTQPACVNNPLQIINTTQNNTSSTLNYVWDFGNGQGSVIKNPVYSYLVSGNYTISLSASTAQCPTSFATKQLPVQIQAAAAGIRYAEKVAILNFPLQLQARQIGTSVLWTPATSLSNRASYSPTFRGLTTQLYTIQMKTASGCLTVDTQLVITLKKIEIYVPNAFTPATSTGLNDYLKPLLFGFVKVNYFRIYNRWGKLLFQMQSDQPGWNGRVNGQLVDPATYVWMIEAVDVDGKVHQKQGTTIILH